VVGIEVDKSHVFGRRNNDHGNISPWQQLARAVTMEAAMKLAQGFSAYRQRWGTSQANVLSLQQGGTTCLTLMCITKASRTPETRNLGLRHLYLLMEQLEEMSDVYSSAKVICSVVKHEMEQLRINFTELLTPPQTPDAFDFQPLGARTRRGSSETPSESGPASKRRRRDKDGPRPKSGPVDSSLKASELGPEGLLQDWNEPGPSSSSQATATRDGLPASPAQDVAVGLSQGTAFLGPNFEPMQLVTDPIFHLHASNPSLPMDFSTITSSFDDPTQDPLNEFLPPWLPDGFLFDMVDDGSGTLPDTLQYC
jgi:hypothetical protein